jgi:hypothetical protein
VERKTDFVVLAKMSSASAADALESFSAALETIPPALRKTLTYDQGREMSYHAALTLRTGVQVYFADPHSPWQRGSNEKTNGLLRQCNRSLPPFAQSGGEYRPLGSPSCCCEQVCDEFPWDDGSLSACFDDAERCGVTA